jgi:nitrilase
VEASLFHRSENNRGALYDKPGVLIEEIDLDEIPLSKLEFDVVGHYSRDDIFSFNVLNQPEIKKE